jgi:glycosyltransferase involved in cell wall biosynthesis
MVKISVCCITYNHESYLAMAIESVLAQKFDGIIEMVIGEDCSKDSTRSIALNYQEKFPSQIKVLTPASNLGIMSNLVATLNACDGDYIAMLDGDDYWTDDTKLQRQVDALQANMECTLCLHDAETFTSETGTVDWTFGSEFSHILPAVGSPPQLYSQLDIARHGWFIPTASMLFRASSIPRPMPAWFEGIYSGDYALQLFVTKQGPAIYLPRIMSRYRVHQQSVGATMRHSKTKYERRIYEAKMFQQHVFEPKNRKHADIYLAIQYEGFAHFMGSQGQYWQQLKFRALALLYNWQRIPVYIERHLPTAAKS